MCSRMFLRMSVAVLLSSTLLVFSLLPLFTAFAQESVAVTPPVSEEGDRMMCVDLYDATQLTATVSLADDATIAPGGTVSGEVNLAYGGDQALYGMNLYVALLPSTAANATLNTPQQFARLAEGVTLGAGFNESYAFSLATPESLASGSYQVAIYMMQQDEATARGLAAYGRAPLVESALTVAGNPTPLVTFGDSLTIEGETVDVSTYYRLTSSDPLTGSITATNESEDTPAMGTVTIELYEGMLSNPQKLLTRTTDEIRLMPGRSRETEFPLQYVIEDLQQFHNTNANRSLDADSYVLTATVAIDGVVVETFSVPLVTSEEALVTDEPILEYVYIEPSNATANACVSYVESYFEDARPNEAIELTITAVQDGTEAITARKAFYAGDYQQFGPDEFGLSEGLYQWIQLSDIDPGSYELVASLQTGVRADDPEVYPVPKDVKQETAAITVAYNCPDDLCGSEEVTASPAANEKPTSQMLAIGVLVSLVALIIVFSAVRAVAGRKKREDFNDVMDEFTDSSDDGLGESNDHEDK